MTETVKKKRRTLDEQIADLERSRKLQLGKLLAKEQLRLSIKALNQRNDADAAAHAVAGLRSIVGLPTVPLTKEVREHVEAALDQVVAAAEMTLPEPEPTEDGDWPEGG